MYNEEMIEQYMIDMFKDLDYEYIEGNNLDGKNVIMKEILVDSLVCINGCSRELIEKYYNMIFSFSSNDLVENNMEFSKRLIHGISFNDEDVPYHIKLIDDVNVENNVFYVVNQYPIYGDRFNKRPDVVVFINGIPIVLIELKTCFNSNVELESGYNQVDTYKHTISDLFRYVQFNVISNGVTTKLGTLTSDYNRYAFYREATTSIFDIEVVVPDLFAKDKLVDVVLNYIENITTKSGFAKIMLQYHQMRAIQKFKDTYDGGYIWHTQGSGKSYTMAFMSMQILKYDPTARIVVVTDRNDLDAQLHGTFISFKNTPLVNAKRIEKRSDLKTELSKQYGSVVFMTIQKLEEDHGLINDNGNIYIITDEAHRSQYGLGYEYNRDNETIKAGFAQMLRDGFPNAKYIGFTGTPIENDDKSTYAVFGRQIDKYDINQSVEDKSTVPIKYSPIPQSFILDENVINELEDVISEFAANGANKRAINREMKKLSKLDAVLGDKNRISEIVKKLLFDFDENLKSTGMKSIYVATNREIAVSVYNAIKKVRPEMCSADIDKGMIKVIMTGNSSDKPTLVKHHTSSSEKVMLANRFKDDKDDFKLAIVVDMWLTGFDAPCVNTMYVDKLMKNHTLMQAITRVNRVYNNKEEGRIIDFIGIANNLNDALKIYSTGNDDNPPMKVESIEELLSEFKRLLNECQMLTTNFNWTELFKNTNDLKDKFKLLSDYSDIISGNDEVIKTIKQIKNLKNRISVHLTNEELQMVAFLSAAIDVTDTLKKDELITIDELKNRINEKLKSYFQGVETLEVVEILNLTNNEIDIFNDKFLEAIRQSNNDNINISLLEKLLKITVRKKAKENMIKSSKLLDDIKDIVAQFQSGQLASAIALEELLKLCEQIKQDELNSGTSQKSHLNGALKSIIEVNQNKLRADIDDDTINIYVDEIEYLILNIVSEYEGWRNNSSIIATITSSIKRPLFILFEKKDITSINKLIIEQLHRGNY